MSYGISVQGTKFGSIGSYPVKDKGYRIHAFKMTNSVDLIVQNTNNLDGTKNKVLSL